MPRLFLARILPAIQALEHTNCLPSDNSAISDFAFLIKFSNFEFSTPDVQTVTFLRELPDRYDSKGSGSQYPPSLCILLMGSGMHIIFFDSSADNQIVNL